MTETVSHAHAGNPAALGSAAGDAKLLERVRERLARENHPTLTAGVIADALRAESGGLLGDTDLLAALRFLQTELIGAGKLEELFADADVTDILVSGPDNVWFDRGRGLERAAITFADESAVRRLAARLALGAGKRLDDAQPWVDGQLSNVGRRGYTVRLHAVIPPIAAEGTCLSLRVLRAATQDLDGLVASGAVPVTVLDTVMSVLQTRMAFLISGGTGTGKTTLLAALLGALDPAERVVCVEDAAELAPAHPHLVRLLARTANVEGSGEVPMRTLVRQALRMRPDRIVVGEVRGAEVVDLLGALNTGHDGCAGTVHANAPSEVPARMEALAALGGMNRAALHSQLAAAVQVVFGVAHRSDGSRGLAEVGMVVRSASGFVEVAPVWSHRTGFTAVRSRFDDVVAARQRC